MKYARHTETRAIVAAAPVDAFAFLDDQEALGAHMTKRSAMMAGGRMTYEFDAAKGKAIGSVVRMRGEMMGLLLEVEEVVTERVAPQRKVLETRGKQKMLVIDAYRLGFVIEPNGDRAGLHRLQPAHRLARYYRGLPRSHLRALVRDLYGESSRRALPPSSHTRSIEQAKAKPCTNTITTRRPLIQRFEIPSAE